ncbi:MAG: hydrogenase maturation protease, partial [Gemmatimonadota bacterium]|nr:hydrogenase maturation protease [Gemmatimonadota bacterium]
VEARTVERPVEGADAWEPVTKLVIGERELATWDEAHARALEIMNVPVQHPFADRTYAFHIDGGREVELVQDNGCDTGARIVRERWPLSCEAHVSVERVGGIRKLRIRLENLSRWDPDVNADRTTAVRRSLVGTHMLLAASNGAFISLVDPPSHAAASASSCTNLHTWPVLVGQPPDRTLMLSAPIILYDYPAVAPESPGDSFDGTEIDELLALRVLTLTEAEREEALATDPRAREVIERAATLPAEAFERLHGAIRQRDPVVRQPAEISQWEAFLNAPGNAKVEPRDAGGRPITKGARVRLSPSAGRRADAMDMFLGGQTATVAAVHRDLEDEEHIAVTVDATGATDIHDSTGRYFYFRPDEVEVLDNSAASSTKPSEIRERRILVAGIGNMFLGDDGFGCAVIQRLASLAVPSSVKVEDFGVKSLHLAYDLLGASPAYDLTILVDAVSRGGAPGTLYVIEPDAESALAASPDAHAMNVESVLSLLKHLGGTPGRVLVVGCEVASTEPHMGLSDAVAGAVDGGAELVMKLIATEES